MSFKSTLTVLCLVLMTGCAGRGPLARLRGTTASTNDDAFIQYAAMQAHGIIDVSEAATHQASTNKTRDLARTIAGDQRSTLDKLTRLAERRRLALPSEPDTYHRQLLEDLPRLQGEDFDRAYLAAMERDHEAIIPIFEDKAGRAETTPVRTLASQAAPQLRHHQSLIQSAVADAP